MRRWALAVAMWALLVAACGATDDTTTTRLSSTTSTEADVGTSTPTSSPDDETVIVVAVADLADRLQVDPEEIEVVIHEDVTWNDGAMGCPEPGLSYTQALVDGYRIVLSAGDAEYHYHGRSGDLPFLCDEPQLPGGGGVTE